MSAVHECTWGFFTLTDQLGRAVLPLFVCCEGAAPHLLCTHARACARAVVWACGPIVWWEAAYDHATMTVMFSSRHALEWDLSTVLPGCVECVRVRGTRRTISHRSRMRRLRPAEGLAQMFYADSIISKKT